MCHVAHMANTLLHPFSQSRQWWINMNKLDLAHTKKGSAQSHAIFLPMKGPIYFRIKPYCWWKNPAPVDMVNILLFTFSYKALFKKIYILGGDRRISEPSTVSNIYLHKVFVGLHGARLCRWQQRGVWHWHLEVGGQTSLDCWYCINFCYEESCFFPKINLMIHVYTCIHKTP